MPGKMVPREHHRGPRDAEVGKGGPEEAREAPWWRPGWVKWPQDGPGMDQHVGRMWQDWGKRGQVAAKMDAGCPDEKQK